MCKRSRLADAVALALVLPLLVAAAAAAQSVTAEIWGRVADPSGDVVPSAAVSVTNVDTGATREVFTDRRGLFTAPELMAGRYQVTVVCPGYASMRQDDIELLPGRRESIEIRLRLARLPETTLALNPHPPILESGRTHSSAFIADAELQELPVAGRRYLGLAELTPDVTRDARSGGISVMGLSSTQNRLVVDGFDHTSSLTGDPWGREGPARVPSQLDQAFLEAFRIQRSGSPAQTGRDGGAVIDVVTKSGANTLSGSGYEFFGNQLLNGRTILDERAGLGKPPYGSHQFGTVIGGPIARDRSFFLVSYDGLRRDVAPAASPDAGPFTSEGQAAVRTLRAAFARVARREDQDLELVRTDHDYFGQHIMLRYLGQRFAGLPIDAAPMQPAISSAGSFRLRTRSGAAGLTSTLGPTIVNDARAQYVDSRETELPPPAPALVVWQAGTFVAQAGSSMFGPRAFSTRRLQMSDSVSLTAGAHSIKSGVDVLRDLNTAGFGLTSTYGFQTIQGFASGLPNGPGDWYSQTFEARDAAARTDVEYYSAFLQDAWRVRPSVTLDVGLRYDVQVVTGGGTAAAPALAAAGLGSAIHRERGDWAPRVGLAWAPGARRHVVRAAYGLFYSATPAMIAALARAFNGVNLQSVTLRGTLNDSMPAYPATLTSIPAAAPTSVVVIDPSFRGARVHQASIGWESERYRTGSFGFDYTLARGERLPRPVEINLGGRFAGLDRVVSFRSTGESHYNGLSAYARGSMSAEFFFTFAYTFSIADETPLAPLGMIFGGLSERNLPALDDRSFDTRAPSINDQRHRFVISGSYDTSMLAGSRHGLSKTLLDDWTIALVSMVHSGQRYSAYINGDVNGDRNAFNDLAPDATRNEYRLPLQMSLDPRISRRFALGAGRTMSVIWEAFNVTNHANYTAVDDTSYVLNDGALVPNPLFGRRTGQSDGRIMMLAARVRF